MTTVKDVMRVRDVCDELGIARSTLSKLRKNGAFPEPTLRIGTKLVAWRREDYLSWVNQNHRPA